MSDPPPGFTHSNNADGTPYIPPTTPPPDAAKENTMADPTAPAKPGYKTSEFWLSSLATIAGIALASGALSKPDAEHVTQGVNLLPQLAGLITTIAGTLGYLWSRTKIKT